MLWIKCETKDELMDYVFSKNEDFWVRPYVDVGGELNESRPLKVLDLFCSKKMGWKIGGMNYNITDAIEMQGMGVRKEIIYKLEGVWDEIE